jgi:hypothetical protein
MGEHLRWGTVSADELEIEKFTSRYHEICNRTCIGRLDGLETGVA